VREALASGIYLTLKDARSGTPPLPMRVPVARDAFDGAAASTQPNHPLERDDEVQNGRTVQLTVAMPGTYMRGPMCAQRAPCQPRSLWTPGSSIKRTRGRRTLAGRIVAARHRGRFLRILAIGAAEVDRVDDRT
jgi:hypothetical protein